MVKSREDMQSVPARLLMLKMMVEAIIQFLGTDMLERTERHMTRLMDMVDKRYEGYEAPDGDLGKEMRDNASYFFERIKKFRGDNPDAGSHDAYVHSELIIIAAIVRALVIGLPADEKSNLFGVLKSLALDFDKMNANAAPFSFAEEQSHELHERIKNFVRDTSPKARPVP